MENKYLYQFNIDEHPIGSWLYAYGTLASKEKRFFKETQIQQLFQANSEETLLNLIREANYTGDTIDDALNQSEIEDFELLRTSNPNFSLIRLFLIEKDAHNLKVILRAGLGSGETISLSDIEHLFVGPYTVEPRRVLDCLNSHLAGEPFSPSQSFGKEYLPDWIDFTIRQAIKNYSLNYDLADIDHLVDQQKVNVENKLTSEIDSEWLTDYYLSKQDFQNLEMIFRCRSLRMDNKFFVKSILSSGTISIEEWTELYEHSDEELSSELTKKGFGEFTEFVGNYRELGMASKFSQQVDSFLIRKIKAAKSIGPGVENVASYFLVRSLERKIIRVARAVATNKFSAQRISQLIRSGY